MPVFLFQCTGKRVCSINPNQNEDRHNQFCTSLPISDVLIIAISESTPPPRSPASHRGKPSTNHHQRECANFLTHLINLLFSSTIFFPPQLSWFVSISIGKLMYPLCKWISVRISLDQRQSNVHFSSSYVNLFLFVDNLHSSPHFFFVLVFRFFGFLWSNKRSKVDLFLFNFFHLTTNCITLKLNCN